MAITDADYCFTAIDVGSFGSCSDSFIFQNSKFGSLLSKGEVNVPNARKLPHDNEGTPMPFVLVGDEAFANSSQILRPYARQNLTVSKRIFNYRLSRARRMVECTFGILANKWRIFHRPLDVNTNFCDAIIKACCIPVSYTHLDVYKRQYLQCSGFSV